MIRKKVNPWGQDALIKHNLYFPLLNLFFDKFNKKLYLPASTEVKFKNPPGFIENLLYFRNQAQLENLFSIV